MPDDDVGDLNTPRCSVCGGSPNWGSFTFDLSLLELNLSFDVAWPEESYPPFVSKAINRP